MSLSAAWSPLVDARRLGQRMPLLMGKHEECIPRMTRLQRALHRAKLASTHLQGDLFLLQSPWRLAAALSLEGETAIGGPLGAAGRTASFDLEREVRLSATYSEALRQSESDRVLRGRLALVFANDFSKKTAGKVSRLLRDEGTTVLGMDESGVLLVKWDAKAHLAADRVVKLASIETDMLKPGQLRQMPEAAARIGTLWNWSIETRERRVTDAQFKALLVKLKIEIRKDVVFDALLGRKLGKVQIEEKRETQGNWCLVHQRYRQVVPGFFGYGERLECRTRTFRDYPACSGTRQTMDLIEAEVSGTHHYAYQSRDDASSASAHDWAYVWVGEHHCRGYSSRATLDGATAGWGYHACD